ncbi:MAG: hypothetical protein V2B20_16285 [Pseudomonadota bacterium]
MISQAISNLLYAIVLVVISFDIASAVCSGAGGRKEICEQISRDCVILIKKVTTGSCGYGTDIPLKILHNYDVSCEYFSLEETGQSFRCNSLETFISMSVMKLYWNDTAKCWHMFASSGNLYKNAQSMPSSPNELVFYAPIPDSEILKALPENGCANMITPNNNLGHRCPPDQCCDK